MGWQDPSDGGAAMKDAIRWISGFVRADMPQSSTRLAGLSVTGGAIVFAFRHPDQAATVAALLAGAVGTFYGRTRADGTTSAGE